MRFELTRKRRLVACADEPRGMVSLISDFGCILFDRGDSLDPGRKLVEQAFQPRLLSSPKGRVKDTDQTSDFVTYLAVNIALRA